MYLYQFAKDRDAIAVVAANDVMVVSVGGTNERTTVLEWFHGGTRWSARIRGTQIFGRNGMPVVRITVPPREIKRERDAAAKSTGGVGIVVRFRPAEFGPVPVLIASFEGIDAATGEVTIVRIKRHIRRRDETRTLLRCGGRNDNHAIDVTARAVGPQPLRRIGQHQH